MLNLVKSIPLRNKVQAYSTAAIERALSRLLVGVLQVAMALYLLPVFAAVFAASVLGVLVLAVRDIFCGSVSREASVPQDRFGLEIFRG